MKTVGIIGGISWQSTLIYYRLLNQLVSERLGGHHSADLRIWSQDFEELHQAQERDDQDLVAQRFVEAGKALAAAGADILVIASNTSHQHADLIESESGRPLVHIIDATAVRIDQTGMETVLLLGTDYTMSGEFYKERMRANGIECIVPDESDRTEVHRIIFEELVHGVVDDGSHRTLVDIIDAQAEQGAEGVILGCTELGMILDVNDARIPGFDSTMIHCHAIVDQALS